MSAWAELVNADGSDEWLEKCEAALLEVQRETLRKAAAKIRWADAPSDADQRFVAYVNGWCDGRNEAADLIDPESDRQ